MSAPNLQTIYDHEHHLETAFASVISAAFPEFPVIIPGDPPEFEKAIPRIELAVEVGAATDHRSTNDDVYRCDSWVGTLMVAVITQADYVQLRTHRGLLRALLGRIETDLTNGGTELLPYHSVNRCVENGSNNEYAPEAGLFRLNCNYEIHFNIRPDAWPEA